MGILEKMRKQKAVLWVRNTTSALGTPGAFAAPVEIKCRWERDTGNHPGPRGDVVDYNHVVYVDREVKKGDYLREGEMESGIGTNPQRVADAGEVAGVKETPTFNAKKRLRIAYVR